MLFSDSGDCELATREIAGDLAESRGRPEEAESEKKVLQNTGSGNS